MSKHINTVFIILLCILGTTFTFAAILIAEGAYSTTVSFSASGTIFSHQLPNGADYYVLEDTGTYHVVDTNNPEANFDGLDASSVINSVLQKMLPDQKIMLNGNFELSESLRPKSNSYLNFGKSNISSVSGSIRAIDIISENDITIEGGHFYGYADNSGLERGIRAYMCDRVTIKNGVFEGVGSGITIECLDGVGHIIQNNTFLYAPGSWAFVGNDIGNSVITENYIDSSGDGSGIGVFGSGKAYSNTVEISHNTITGWSQVLWHAIYVAGTPNSKIHSNSISNPLKGSCGVAILVKSTNTLIYNNIISDTPNWGLHIYQEGSGEWNSPSGSSIYGNIFKNSEVGGIYYTPSRGYNVQNIEIKNNSFSELTTPIDIEGNSMTEMAITTVIEDNTFDRSTYGVKVGPHDGDSYVNDIIISNNFFNEIGPYSAIIIGSQTTGATITYNTFTSCSKSIQDYGISSVINGNMES